MTAMAGLMESNSNGEVLTLPQLRERREEILRIAAAGGARNVRVVGWVARGEALPESDVDLLVDFEEGRDVLDLSGLILDLEEALGRRVDVLELRPAFRLAPALLRDAIAL
jgi:predicted nucleotidyltransferase